MQTLIILSGSIVVLFILAIAALFSKLKNGFRLFIILVILSMGISLVTLVLAILAVFTGPSSLPAPIAAIIISVACLYFSLFRITQGHKTDQS